MKGANLLDNQGDVRIVIANEVLETVSPSKTTVPGLGYIKRSFTQKNVVDARKIEVEREIRVLPGELCMQNLNLL